MVWVRNPRAAVEQFRFRSGMKEGDPVNVSLVAEINFHRPRFFVFARVLFGLSLLLRFSEVFGIRRFSSARIGVCGSVRVTEVSHARLPPFLHDLILIQRFSKTVGQGSLIPRTC